MTDRRRYIVSRWVAGRRVSHWAAKYIGDEYDAVTHDCWGFCRRVWAEQFSLDVPVVTVSGSNLRAITRAFGNNPERANWRDVDFPQEGDAVLLAHSRYPSHVGIWVEADGGGVLHCQDPMGVIFSSRAALVRAGWAHLQFYRRIPA